MEILIVAVVALIVFGPQRLPEIARTIGRTLQEFRRQAADIRSEFEAGIDSFDPKLDEVDDEVESSKGSGKVEPALDPAAGDASSDVTAGAEPAAEVPSSKDAATTEPDPYGSGSSGSGPDQGAGSDLDNIPAKPSRTQPDMRPDR